MATTLTFYGYSDDLIEIEGSDQINEVEADTNWAAHLRSPDGEQLQVVLSYINPGVWSAGLARADEDIPMPDWPVELVNASDCAYATALKITVPDGTRIVNYTKA